VGFDFDGTGVTGRPVVEAAPRVVLKLRYHAACDGIAVNVSELLDEFGIGEDIEVVVAGLPELEASAFEEL
jgi:hypothetical protein